MKEFCRSNFMFCNFKEKIQHKISGFSQTKKLLLLIRNMSMLFMFQCKNVIIYVGNSEKF